jgi:hypothetical protein
MTRRRAVGVVVAAGVLLIGCGGGDASAPDDVGSMRFADLQAAAEVARSCIADAGYEVTTDYASDIYVHGFSVAADGPDVDRTIASCTNERYQAVADRWQALHSDEIDARNSALEARIVACLHDAGFEFGELDDASRDAIDRRDPSARARCLAAASEPPGEG